MKKYRKTFLVVCFLVLCGSLMAQPPTPPATPIDGGLGILLAGGALYGASKIRKKFK